MVDSMNPYGNTLALALASNEVITSNAAQVAEPPPHPAAAA
jgi:hypothetical protein